MKVYVIHGPNMNMLGIREPDIYGRQTYDDLVEYIRARCEENGMEPESFQSNHEGDIIDKLHEEGFGGVDGVVLNAGGYTHTSVAIADGISAIKVPVIEVHISNVNKREEFRRHSYISPVCAGTIAGFGLDSYRLGIEAIKGGK